MESVKEEDQTGEKRKLDGTKRTYTEKVTESRCLETVITNEKITKRQRLLGNEPKPSGIDIVPLSKITTITVRVNSVIIPDPTKTETKDRNNNEKATSCRNTPHPNTLQETNDNTSSESQSSDSPRRPCDTGASHDETATSWLPPPSVPTENDLFTPHLPKLKPKHRSKSPTPTGHFSAVDDSSYQPPPTPATPFGGDGLLPSYPTSSNAAALMNSSQYLAYSWDSLRLGKELGTFALNDFIRRVRIEGRSRRQGNNVDEEDDRLTAQDALLIINGLQTKTSLPPKRSDLHRIVQKTRFDNRNELLSSSEDETECENGKKQKNYDLRLPFKPLARLYEFMCSQDADDGSYIRREVHYLSAKACVDKLRSLENTVCDLKLKETATVERAERLGLHPLEPGLLGGFESPDDALLHPS